MLAGTKKERGIAVEGASEVSAEKEKESDSSSKESKGNKTASDQGSSGDEDKESEFEEGLEVYHLPWIPDCIQYSALSKVFRIFPGKGNKLSPPNSEHDQEAGKLLQANE
jgi:hypothetical protein